MSEDTRFAWREFATMGAAYSCLANELEDATRTVFNKQDREALARVMLRHTEGKIVVGGAVITWKHEENTDGRAGDLLYAIDD